MKYYAKLLYIHPYIEEEMLLCLGEVKLLCFANSIPYPVQVGEIYPVELSLTYLEECKLRPIAENEFSISELTTVFSHKVRGFLAGNQLISQGVTFQDDYFAEEYAWLDGHFVETIADRITADFC